MLLFIKPATVLKSIAEPKCIRKDILIPEKSAPVVHSPYRPGYDWLFGYERKLARFLEPWLKKYRYELIGEKGLLCEALSNAFYHGHRKNAALPITVSIYLGGKGLIIRIKDAGSGFDLNTVFEKYARGKTYFHSAGNGLKLMNASKRFGIFYNHAGTAFHLLHLFGEDIEQYRQSITEMREGRIAVNANTPIGPTPFRRLDIDTTLMKAPWGQRWARSAMLMDVEGCCKAGFGVEPEKIAVFFKTTADIFHIAEKISSRLHSGDVEILSIPSSRGTLTIYRDPSERQTLVAVLKEKTRPAMTRVYLTRLYKYLSAA